MVDTGALETFLNDKSAKDNDIIEILGEGVLENKEDSTSKRKYVVLNLPVRNGVQELIYSPNKDAIDVLTKAYGKDTKNWVNKKFSVKLYPKTSFGVTKMAILPVIIEVKI